MPVEPGKLQRHKMVLQFAHQPREEQYQEGDQTADHMDGMDAGKGKVAGSPQVAIRYGGGKMQLWVLRDQLIDLIAKLAGCQRADVIILGIFAVECKLQ